MKIKVSISSHAPAPPGEEHTIYAFTPPVLRFGVPDKTGVGLIPHQQIGSKNVSDAISYLRKLKLTGYDWRPEHLSELNLGGTIMFFSTSHQYPDEVEAQLSTDGYKIKRITVTEGEWAILEEQERERVEGVSVAPKTVGLKAAVVGDAQHLKALYGRTRYLWKHHKDRLNDWERDFVTNVGKRLSNAQTISTTQSNRLEQLFTKHGVPQEATASRAYPDSDLSTLRAVVPNGNFAQFDPSDDLHFTSGWHGNPAGQSKKTKKTISGYTKAEKKRRRAIEKKKAKDALELEKRRNQEHPKDNANQVDRSLSADFSSFHGIGDSVIINLNKVRLAAKVLAVAFMEGKVLYTVCVWTGFPEDKSLAEQYGILNSIGWDGEGREYIRVSNLDSTFVERNPGL